MIRFAREDRRKEGALTWKHYEVTDGEGGPVVAKAFAPSPEAALLQAVAFHNLTRCPAMWVAVAKAEPEKSSATSP